MYGDLYKLKELPFITNVPNDGRAIPSIHFFDEKTKRYRLFLPHKNNKFMEMNTGGRDLLKGIYWSKYNINPKKDLFMGVIHLLSNNFSFEDPNGKNKGLVDLTNSLIQDIHNFGAIIHKQFIIWDYIKSLNKLPSRTNAYDIYATEIEYLMGLIRSFFDLFYNIFRLLSEISNPNMININFKKVSSLGGFSDKVGRDIKSTGKSQIDVLKSYGLTNDFIIYFRSLFPLFRLSRKIRDAIYHDGDTPNIIFITENGPGIGMRNFDPYYGDPFLSFKEIFKREENFNNCLMKNDIVSLFYFINVIIGSSLDYAELFGQAVLSFYKKLPENISNEYKIFIKGPEIKYINKIPNYLRDAWMMPLNKSFFNPEYWNLLKV